MTRKFAKSSSISYNFSAKEKGAVWMRKPTARAAAYGYACALVTVLWLFLPHGGYERLLEGKYTCFLLLTVGYLSATLWTDRRELGRVRWTAADAAAAAYLFASALSSFCSPYGAQTLLGGTRRDGLVTLTLYVLTFWLLSRHLRPDRRLLFLTALSATICDALVLLQLRGRNPLWLYPAGLNYFDGDVAYAGFYAGTSGNIDFTAFLLALAACVLTAAMLRLRLWALTPTVALTLWTLCRLDVAAAWVGIACAAIWGLALLIPRRRALLLSAVLTVAAPAFLLCYQGESQTLREASLLLRGRADGSFGSGRLSIWRDCWYLVRERPLLGGGPDTLWLRGLEPLAWVHDGSVIPSDITAAHNEYLNILANQGAVALAAYLVLLAMALLHCFRRASEPRCALCGVGLLCYAAMAVFSISTCITAPFVWLLLALCNPHENHEKTQLKNGQK